jgi:uncharacterized membrane protein YhhN
MNDTAPLVLFTVCSLVLHLVAERGHHRVGRGLTKAAASAGFIAIALSVGALESAWGQTLLIAFGLSMLGDLLLLSKATSMFAGGLVSFLLAHIAFGAAFITLGLDPTVTAGAVLALIVVALGVARWVLPHAPQRLRAAIIAYIVAVSGMAALALSASWSTGDPTLALGGVAFFISDLFVARGRFIAPGFSNRILGMPLYYGAQILFALQAAPRSALFAC